MRIFDSCFFPSREIVLPRAVDIANEKGAAFQIV